MCKVTQPCNLDSLTTAKDRSCASTSSSAPLLTNAQSHHGAGRKVVKVTEVKMKHETNCGTTSRTAPTTITGPLGICAPLCKIPLSQRTNVQDIGLRSHPDHRSLTTTTRRLTHPFGCWKLIFRSQACRAGDLSSFPASLAVSRIRICILKFS